MKIKSKDIGRWFRSFSGDIKIQVGNRWIDVDQREGDIDSILSKLKSKESFEFEYDVYDKRLINPEKPYEEYIPEKSVAEWTRERREELNRIEAEAKVAAEEVAEEPSEED